jgi:hypothetical protein
MKIMTIIDFTKVALQVTADVGRLATRLRSRAYWRQCDEPESYSVGYGDDSVVIRHQIANPYQREHHWLQNSAQRFGEACLKARVVPVVVVPPVIR